MKFSFECKISNRVKILICDYEKNDVSNEK